MRVEAERDALAAALADIAGGECWQTRCPDEDDLCDTCTARKALGLLPAGSDGGTVTGGGVL